MKKTALVTGGNKGIGFAIVRGLAKTGMSVWMGARDRSRGEEAVAILREEGFLLDYTSSKVALNAVTVSFAKELEPYGIKVNAVEPGHVRTDLNANTGILTPDEGAATAIKMALAGPDGPTGCFFGSHGRQPW